MRRVERGGDLGRRPDEPAGRHLGQRRAHLSRPQGAGRAAGLAGRRFAWEFRQGMAARAKALGDTGESGPEHWEPPLGTPDVHVVLAALAPDSAQLEAALDRARPAYRDLPGVDRDLAAGLPRAAHRRPNPSATGTASATRPSRAAASPGPTRWRRRSRPASSSSATATRLGGFQTLPTRGAGAQRHLRGLPQAPPARRRVPAVPEGQRHRPRGRGAAGGEDDGTLAQRRAAGALPVHDDPDLGADPRRNNDFLYERDDPTGFTTPGGCHIRRGNPRDASVAGVAEAAPDDPTRHRLRARRCPRASWRTTGPIAG